MGHKLLGICGALRKGSTNLKLLNEALRIYDPAAFDIADLNLPLYDGDLEKQDGIPEAVQKLSDQIAAADGVIISSPEYNKAIPGGLKNAFDWISRTKGGPWAGKPVALMAANAGRAGGETGFYNIRHAMAPFRPRFANAPAVLIADSGNAFDEEGRLISEMSQKGVETLMQALRDEIELLAKAG